MANNTLDTYAKCLDAFKRDVTNVISNLNIAKHQEAMENMRKALESMVKATIHYKNLDAMARTAGKKIKDLTDTEKNNAKNNANSSISGKDLE